MKVLNDSTHAALTAASAQWGTVVAAAQGVSADLGENPSAEAVVAALVASQEAPVASPEASEQLTTLQAQVQTLTAQNATLQEQVTAFQGAPANPAPGASVSTEPAADANAKQDSIAKICSENKGNPAGMIEAMKKEGLI